MSRRRGTLSAIASIAVLVAACSGRGAPATAEPGVAAAIEDRTAPDRPLRVVFDWTILDGDARFTGRGVARIEPAYHARLDLFGPRGDGYLSAALVGDEVRLPPGTRAVSLPAPAMMWAVLGVVAPPAGAILIGTRVDGERTELHYTVDESRLRYTLERGRLRGARWDGAGRRLSVDLEGAMEPAVASRAHYRDWSGNTELMLEVEEVDEVDSYPEDIWVPVE